MSDERERLIGELRHIENTLPSSGIGTAAYQAAAMLRADGKRIKALKYALAWCGGSPDFNDGGQAVEGWRKICAPLLEGKDHG